MTFIKESILNFDRAVFFFFQRLQSPSLDPFLAWPTYLGDWKVILPLLIFGILVFGKRKKSESIPAAILAIIYTEWLNNFLKSVFQRARPYVYWEQVKVIFPAYSNPAFPSGHAAVVFAAAVVLSHYYPKKAFWFYAVAAWAAVTRLYIGVHYPTDLIAGAVVGALCGKLACWLTGRFGRYLIQVNKKKGNQ